LARAFSVVNIHLVRGRAAFLCRCQAVISRQSLGVVDPASEALSPQDADFDLNHVEPACVLAPRIRGEPLKLGFEVAQSSVAKYMVKRRGPPSQGWRTFLRNHAPDIAAMDLFVVPTIGNALRLRDCKARSQRSRLD
jgi:hypothetical protein